MLTEHRRIEVETSLSQAGAWEVFVPEGRHVTYLDSVSTAELRQAAAQGVAVFDRETGRAWSA
ncbi:MAG TPA: hypothetical protein VHC18_06610 [Amycolatopsis sp.]|nr:hypothetical protein [Amycolatopsis sp.]